MNPQVKANTVQYMPGNRATPKVRALGSAIRELREEAGIGLREFARRLGKDPGAISRIENGKRGAEVAEIARMLTALGVDGTRYDELVEMARGGMAGPLWLPTTLPEPRQHLAAVLEFDRTATVITEVSPMVVPGLVQTSDYTRAVMSAGRVPASEIETRVAIGIGRRDVILRRHPVHFVALIGEAALHQMIGGRGVLLDQCRYLLELAEMSNVDIRVVPFGTGWYPGLEAPFLLIDSDTAQPVVQLETRISGLFLSDDEYVTSYRKAVDAVVRVALSQGDSVSLIAAEAGRLESGG